MSVASAFMGIRHRESMGDVLSHVFTISVRRKLALERDMQAIAEYIRRAFVVVEGTVHNQRARQAEALVRRTLGEPLIGDELEPDISTELAMTLMPGLVSVWDMTTDNIGELITAAEVRLERAGKLPGREGLTRAGRLRRGDAGSASPRPDPFATLQEKTRMSIGEWLRWVVLYARSAGERAPEDSTELRAAIEAAFEIVVDRRFKYSECRHPAAFVAYNVSKRYPNAKIDAIDAEALVRAQLGEADAAEGIDDGHAGVIKALCFSVMAHDLGLFDHEIDDLVRDAERLAIERGFDLGAAPNE
jgi:NTP pyrophosphatase (non-canonical NTP hydrolase)